MPDAINLFLWPYAVKKANVDLNHIKLRDQQYSPVEYFASVSVRFRARNFHAFGCPMFVLESKLQAGHNYPKWEARARLAIYLGSSMNHAANVGLALSLTTGLVSPAFHAKYDDSFSTVVNALRSFIPKSQWHVRCGFYKENESSVPNDTANHGPDEMSALTPDQQVDAPQYQGFGRDNILVNDGDNVANSKGGIMNPPNMPVIKPNATVERPTEAPLVTNQNAANRTVTTRSGRVSKPPLYLRDHQLYESNIISDTSHDFTMDVDPVSLMVASNQDVLYFHEILKEQDKAKFINAMKDEMNNHNTNKNWITIKRCDLPKDTKAIPSVWAMRRKRNLPDGSNDNKMEGPYQCGR
jgi:hypothetical protein